MYGIVTRTEPYARFARVFGEASGVICARPSRKSRASNRSSQPGWREA
jgi:hypothetical protein